MNKKIMPMKGSNNPRSGQHESVDVIIAMIVSIPAVQ